MSRDVLGGLRVALNHVLRCFLDDLGLRVALYGEPAQLTVDDEGYGQRSVPYQVQDDVEQDRQNDR